LDVHVTCTVFYTDADELCSTLYLTVCIYCTSLKDPWRDPLGTSSIISSLSQLWLFFHRLF